jgi:hypothetical protein
VRIFFTGFVRQHLEKDRATLQIMFQALGYATVWREIWEADILAVGLYEQTRGAVRSAQNRILASTKNIEPEESWAVQWAINLLSHFGRPDLLPLPPFVPFIAPSVDPALAPNPYSGSHLGRPDLPPLSPVIPFIPPFTDSNLRQSPDSGSESGGESDQTPSSSSDSGSESGGEFDRAPSSSSDSGSESGGEFDRAPNSGPLPLGHRTDSHADSDSKLHLDSGSGGEVETNQTQASAHGLVERNGMWEDWVHAISDWVQGHTG